MSCVFCKEELEQHCPDRDCRWTHCRVCGVTLDLANRRGYTRQGDPVQWPYSRPVSGRDQP